MPITTIVGLHSYEFDKQEKSPGSTSGLLQAGTYANPYVEDDWQIIKGVGWSGLAVEFESKDQVDYIGGQTSLDLTTATMSFWFRVPQESLDAATRAQQPGNGLRVFDGVVPLISWGTPNPVESSAQVQENFQGSFPAVGGGNYVNIITESVATIPIPMAPSFIGVAGSGGGPNFDQPSLTVQLQMQSGPSCQNTRFIQESTFGSDIGLPNTLTRLASGAATTHEPPFTMEQYYNVVDVSQAVTGTELQYFGNSSADSTGDGANHPVIMVDKWNHLMLSWQLLPADNMGGGGSIMYCVLNGNNFKGFDLPAMNQSGSGQTHVSQTVSRNFGGVNHSVIPDGPLSVVSYSPPPFIAYNIWVPTLINWVSFDGPLTPLQQIEMAELQIFSGICATDAQIVAFVDLKTGKPVPPNAKSPPLEGRQPDILLHGSANWIKGKSTGKNPVRFTPHGKIISYKPDPSLNPTGAAQ